MIVALPGLFSYFFFFFWYLHLYVCNAFNIRRRLLTLLLGVIVRLCPVIVDLAGYLHL